MQLPSRLKSRTLRLGLLATIIVLSLLIYFRNFFFDLLPSKSLSSGSQTTVQKVIDGDTLMLADGLTIRLIGVDTPELHHPDLPIQRFAEEATAFTKKLVAGREVTLTFDQEPTRDTYGRLLAYVFVDGKLLNKEIIHQGYGYAMTRFPHSRQHEFIYAESEARSMQRGLWNYSLTDGRITNLVNRYEQLSPEAKVQLEKVWDDLLQHSQPPAEPPKRIAWQDAAKHYDEYCMVEGEIVRTHNSGKACFLNFHEDWQRHFSAVIFARRFDQFPKQPERYYLHKTVRITGYIKEYEGKPEIILEFPEQIEVVK